MARLQALHDVVIVRREDVVLSKVIKIAETARERAQFGDVVAVGPGKVGEPIVFLRDAPAIHFDAEALEHAVAPDAVARVPVSVAVNDRVLFHPHAGSELKIGGKDYILLHDGQILGVISRESDPASSVAGGGAVAVPDDDDMAGAKEGEDE